MLALETLNTTIEFEGIEIEDVEKPILKLNPQSLDGWFCLSTVAQLYNDDIHINGLYNLI